MFLMMSPAYLSKFYFGFRGEKECIWWRCLVIYHQQTSSDCFTGVDAKDSQV